MKRTFLLTAAILAALSAAAQWQPAGDRIKTVWGENLDPQNVLPEYPRPQLVRGMSYSFEFTLKFFGDFKETELTLGILEFTEIKNVTDPVGGE